jgi:predicted transcriptional regulator
VLSQLLEGPESLSRLSERLSVSPSNVIPRVKELEHYSLVAKDAGKYHLSIGLILAKKIQAAEKLNVLLEKHGQFFNEHDIMGIPEDLLWRIDELECCELIENNDENTAATYNIIFDNLVEPKYVVGISPIFSPKFPDFFLSIARQKTHVSIILTKRIFEKVENEYSSVLHAYLGLDNARLYAIDDARVALAVSDTFFALALPLRDGQFDISSCLASSKESALGWGLGLFEYYRQKSIDVRGL